MSLNERTHRTHNYLLSQGNNFNPYISIIVCFQFIWQPIEFGASTESEFHGHSIELKKTERRKYKIIIVITKTTTTTPQSL